MKQLTADAILHSVHGLPALPAVVLELIQSFGDSDVSAEQLAIKISHDQAIAAKTLRLANSSFYGLPRRAAKASISMRSGAIPSVRRLPAGPWRSAPDWMKTPRLRWGCCMTLGAWFWSAPMRRNMPRPLHIGKNMTVSCTLQNSINLVLTTQRSAASSLSIGTLPQKSSQPSHAITGLGPMLAKGSWISSML